MGHKLVMYFGDEDAGHEVDVPMPECYSYLVLLIDIMSIIGTQFVGLTVRCGNGMVIRNDNDVIRMFDYYKGIEEITLYVERNFGPLVMPSGGSKQARVSSSNQAASNEARGSSSNQVGGNNQAYGSNQGSGSIQAGGSSSNQAVRNEARGTSSNQIGGSNQVGGSNQGGGNNQACGSNQAGDAEGRNEVDVNNGVDFGTNDVYSFEHSDDWEWEGSEGDSDSTNEHNSDEDGTTGSDDDSTDGSDDDDADLLNNYNSDDSADLLSSDDEGGVRVRRKRFDSNLKGIAKPFTIEEGAPIVFEVGHVFGSVDAFRDVLRDYCILGGYNLKRDKNESVRVTAHCLGKGCSWRIHASVTPDNRSFMIKTLKDEHTCVRVLQNKNANSNWISRKLKGLLRADPNMSYELMSKTLADKYGIEPNQQQLYRAKKRARQITEGKHSTSYACLPKYAELLREKSLGTLVKIELYDRDSTEGLNVFKRIFICYDAMKKGFLEGCRPFVGLDGCHLKGPFGGVLLSAVSVDGDKGLFPVAFAVVENECKDSWTFFLHHLYACIGGRTQEKPLVIMSDQTKGLEDTVIEVFPEAKHRFCARHMFANYRKRFAGLDLRLDFWKAVRSYNFMQWKAAMDGMKGHNSDVYDYMMETPVTCWARHAFHQAPKSDHTTNNMTESFNHWVGKFRHKPIIGLLEGIRMKLMTLVATRYGQGTTWENKVTPSALDIVHANMKHMCHCKMLPASRDDYQVLEGTIKYVVNLKNKTCSCNEWDITGLPCKHALCCISHTRENIEDYCHTFFTKETYLNTYHGMIPPIPEVDLTPVNDNDKILPPPLKRLPGRPRIRRRREVGEPGARKRSCTVRCSNCQDLGHNSRGCQRAPVTKKKKSQASSSGQGQAQPRPATLNTAREQAPRRGRGRPPSASTEMGQSLSRGRSRGRGRGIWQVPSRGRGSGRGQHANRGIGAIPATQVAVPSSQFPPIRGTVQWFSSQQIGGIEITQDSSGQIRDNAPEHMRGEGSQLQMGTQQSTTTSLADRTT